MFESTKKENIKTEKRKQDKKQFKNLEELGKPLKQKNGKAKTKSRLSSESKKKKRS